MLALAVRILKKWEFSLCDFQPRELFEHRQEGTLIHHATVRATGP
jgi:hypothetical protein